LYAEEEHDGYGEEQVETYGAVVVGAAQPLADVLPECSCGGQVVQGVVHKWSPRLPGQFYHIHTSRPRKAGTDTLFRKLPRKNESVPVFRSGSGEEEGACEDDGFAKLAWHDLEPALEWAERELVGVAADGVEEDVAEE